ncbi:MAG: hypothetical protein KDJ65_31850 [Anaerolineae bacterium]|nr:hypothetical protein [Anaerolineae bacterium]
MFTAFRHKAVRQDETARQRIVEAGALDPLLRSGRLRMRTGRCWSRSVGMANFALIGVGDDRDDRGRCTLA